MCPGNGLCLCLLLSLYADATAATPTAANQPDAERGSGRTPVSGDGASGGVAGAVAGAAEGVSSLAGPAAAGGTGLTGPGGMVKSASYSALSGLDGAVTSSLAVAPANDPAAAAAAPVPLSSLPASARSGLRGELTHVQLQPLPGGEAFGSHQQQQGGSGAFGGQSGGGRGLGGMPRVQSVPHLRSYGSDAGSPTLAPMPGGVGAGQGAGAPAAAAAAGNIPGLPAFGSTGYGSHFDQQWMGGGMGQHQHYQQQQQHPQHTWCCQQQYWGRTRSLKEAWLQAATTTTPPPTAASAAAAAVR